MRLKRFLLITLIVVLGISYLENNSDGSKMRFDTDYGVKDTSNDTTDNTLQTTLKDIRKNGGTPTEDQAKQLIDLLTKYGVSNAKAYVNKLLEGDGKITDAEIKNLTDAALASPTAKNYQDWQFIFVRNKELMHEFSAEFSAIMSGNPAIPADYDLLFDAPLFVVITLPEKPQSRFAEVDAGIAVQNLALSAQGMGLGSVILGRPKDVFCGVNGARWEKRFGFPEGHHFSIGIVIGHPTMTKDAHPFRPEKITFID